MKKFLIFAFILLSFPLFSQIERVEYNIIKYKTEVYEDSIWWSNSSWKQTEGKIIMYKEFIELNGFLGDKRDIYFITYLDKNESKGILIQLETKAFVEFWIYRIDKNIMALELSDGRLKIIIAYFLDFY